MPRLFVALDVPGAVREALAALRSDDLGGARWTNPEQFHATLRFLGHSSDDRVPAVRASLAAIEPPPRLTLLLDGLTVFPSRRRPRVLIARIAPEETLLTLQQQIEEAAQRLGFEPASKPFRPHVTLARVQRADARAVHAWLRSHTTEGSFTADAFLLYASTLTPAGAVHERLASFPLEP